MSSHGFSDQLQPQALRRSLIFSACASGLGSMFFVVVQGTVFQFFLEEMKLRDRLPFFMALWCLGGLGSLVGSWIVRRTGERKKVFFLGCGLSRLMWLAIGLIPLLKPEWAQGDAAFMWLTAAIFIFYFWHSIGAVAWLSWMGDLVPPKLQGRYWSLRQVGTSFTGVLARIATGAYLELHNDFNAFAVVLACTVVVGLTDALFFIPVEHRPPPISTEKSHIFREFAARLREGPFRKLCLVYILWSISNAVMAPTAFYFQRDTIHLGVGYISAIEGFALVWLTIFSLFWGRYVDQHGYRAPLIVCLLLQAAGPLCYFFAGEGDLGLILVTTVLTSIGFCGVNLFMVPLMMRYSRQNDGSRDAGLAAFQASLAVAQAVVLVVADRHIYEWAGGALGEKPYSTPVYLLILGGVMAVRFLSAAIAGMLPREENETPLRVVLIEAIAANPLQASWRAIKYGVGKKASEDSNDEDVEADGKKEHR